MQIEQTFEIEEADLEECLKRGERVPTLAATAFVSIAKQ